MQTAQQAARIGREGAGSGNSNCVASKNTRPALTHALPCSMRDSVPRRATLRNAMSSPTTASPSATACQTCEVDMVSVPS